MQLHFVRIFFVSRQNREWAPWTMAIPSGCAVHRPKESAGIARRLADSSRPHKAHTRSRITMHIIEEAFGEGCDLYTDVLQCKRDADQAGLRKAYYRSALKHHPDKNPRDAKAASLFHAVTAAYQLLQDPERRADYDETGELPDVADDDEDSTTGTDQWKSYFDAIFGKVTTGGIEAFSAKYKCSDEERRDVLKEFQARKGNLEKMLEFVMLSEPRDCLRWVEDYIRPAMDSGDADTSYTATMEKSLKKLQKKVEQEDAAAAEEEDDEEMEDEDDNNKHAARDDDETETESEDEDDGPSLAARRKQRMEEAAAKKKTAPPARKTKKPVKAKKQKKKGGEDMTDLIAQIQNRRGGNAIQNLGARYGVNVDDDDDDPLGDDKAFAAAQARLKQSKRK